MVHTKSSDVWKWNWKGWRESYIILLLWKILLKIDGIYFKFFKDFFTRIWRYCVFIVFILSFFNSFSRDDGLPLCISLRHLSRKGFVLLLFVLLWSTQTNEQLLGCDKESIRKYSLILDKALASRLVLLIISFRC